MPEQLVRDERAPNILLSIDPEWAEAILDGEKLWEYRKAPPKRGPPMRLVLYATAPVQAAVGVVWSLTDREGEVQTVVDETVDQTPHDREDVIDYFGDSETGHAIRVDTYSRFDTPISREELENAGYPPTQNFRYINTVSADPTSVDSEQVIPGEGPHPSDIRTPEESEPQCPQCRSQKVTSKGPLAGFDCGYCGNEWADITTDNVEQTVSPGDSFRLPDEFAQPLTVESVDGREVRLHGQQSAEYRLTITEDADGVLARKKSPSERKQFGSQWTNSDPVEYRFQPANDG